MMKALWPIGVAFPFVKPDQMPAFRHDVGAEFPARPETEVIAYNCASRGRAGGRGAGYGPCVDGSGLARVFFT